jgi:hypothetical protein
MTSMPATDTIMGTLTEADVTPQDGVSTIAQVEAAILAGDAYVNVHTAQYPAGEVRGQLSAVPEPRTAGLLLVSLVAGIFGIARRHRSA